MKTSSIVSSDTRKSYKRGPNHSGHVGSHRKILKNEEVKFRLAKLIKFNFLCDDLQGTYPTRGQLIMSTGF